MSDVELKAIAAKIQAVLETHADRIRRLEEIDGARLARIEERLDNHIAHYDKTLSRIEQRLFWGTTFLISVLVGVVIQLALQVLR